MAQELSYVLITPHSLSKSRTGGILARLISRTGLDLAAARMFAPGPDLVREYAEAVVSVKDSPDRRIQELTGEYVSRNFSSDPKTGRRRRVVLLLFRGEEAVRKIRTVTGPISFDRRGGETIRDTYGDLLADETGQVRYFEPAVLTASSAEEVEKRLKIWARHSDRDGGVWEGLVEHVPGEIPRRTLVLVKPDSFRRPSGRPGNVIDFFSRTGLYIIGIRVHRMSVAEAMEFYGPVREALRTSMNDLTATRAKGALERELGFPIPAREERLLGQLLGPLFGEHQFANIIRFMSGRSPAEADEITRTQPGTEKCMALIYEGPGAIGKIREVLGPTDPSKAPPGTVRREFGRSILMNAAHASDSEENAKREMAIIKVGDNNFRKAVEEFYGALA